MIEINNHMARSVIIFEKDKALNFFQIYHKIQNISDKCGFQTLNHLGFQV